MMTRGAPLVSRRQALLGLLVCCLVVSLWFSPWWAGGQNLAPLDILNEMMQPWRASDANIHVHNHIVADAVDQYLVYRMVAAESYRSEGWLGWSSLTYGGTAQYANTMALYYDWTMQLHRWFDFWTAWHLGIMGQVVLAAIGMFLFLRGRSVSVIWCICGALAYAANSQFVTWIYHRWALGPFCWVPWILWAADTYRNGSRLTWPLVPVFIALALLGGTLQHGVFVVLVVVAHWIEAAAGVGKPPRLQFALLGRYSFWGLLGAGMAGMMLLPCADAFLASSRLGLHMGMHGTASRGLYPQGPLQPLLNLLAYPLQVFPSIVGRSETVDLLKVFKSELFFITYFGSLPVLVAFVWVFARKCPLLARILVATGLILPLTPAVRYLYQRVYLLFVLGGILAFVHFMQNASDEARKRLFRVTLAISALAIAGWAVASLFLWRNSASVAGFLHRRIVEPSGGSSFGYFREWMQQRADKFQADLFIWSPQQAVPLVLFLAGLAALRMTASSVKRRRTAGAAVLTAVVILEVTVFAARWVTYTDPVQHPLYAVTPEVEALRREVKGGRTATMIEESGYHLAVTPFVPNTLGAYGISTIHGYDSIMPDGMLLINNPVRDPVTLGRMAVTHLITYPGNPKVDPRWIKVWESKTMDLYENPAAVPRYAGFRDEDHLDSFFRKTSAPPVALNETTGKENSRRIEVPPGVRWIRIAENQADGWEYRLGEAWRAVIRAPDASMLIQLPEDFSESAVEMRYRPPLRRLGFEISSASLLATLGGWLWVLRRPRKTEA